MKYSAILLGALATVAAAEAAASTTAEAPAETPAGTGAETCTLIAEDWTQEADAQGRHPKVNFKVPCNGREHDTEWDFAVGNAKVSCDGKGRDFGITFKGGGGLETGITKLDTRLENFNDGDDYKVIIGATCTLKQ